MNLSLSQRQQDILVSTFMTGKQLFVFCLYIYKYNFVLQSHNPVRICQAFYLETRNWCEFSARNNTSSIDNRRETPTWLYFY